MEYARMINQPEYDADFWKSLKGYPKIEDRLSAGRMVDIGTYKFPTSVNGKIRDAIKKNSVFRNIATTVNAQKNDHKIIVRDTDDMASFVEEGGEIPIYDGISDDSETESESHKLAVCVKYDEDFISDSGFDFEGSLTKRLGENFALAEDNAFINGAGVKEPTGILDEDDGAEVGAEASEITYNEMLSLYFSVDKKYRKRAVWLMSDETAIALHKVKDADGNLLWNSNNDTIFGKPVAISEYMPEATTGNKPIAFGDFAFYWIADRRSLSVKALREKFAALDQIGYLALEFIDGKLIRRDAVKVLKIR